MTIQMQKIAFESFEFYLHDSSNESYYEPGGIFRCCKTLECDYMCCSCQLELDLVWGFSMKNFQIASTIPFVHNQCPNYPGMFIKSPIYVFSLFSTDSAEYFLFKNSPTHVILLLLNISHYKTRIL